MIIKIKIKIINLLNNYCNKIIKKIINNKL